MKKLLIAVSLGVTLMSCTDASVASSNLSKQADMFELDRRVVFYNGITSEYILVIKGRCSVDARGGTLAVTCKTGRNQFKKHYLGLSDNVTFFSEQVESSEVDVYKYEVIFKPSVIIPNIKLKN